MLAPLLQERGWGEVKANSKKINKFVSGILVIIIFTSIK
jgi:hypothetical protein